MKKVSVTESLYLKIKKAILEKYSDGQEFSSFDFRALSVECKRPFNDVAVRLNYLANQGTIEERGKIPNKRGGRETSKYVVINRTALMILIPSEQVRAQLEIEKKKRKENIGVHSLHSALDAITRARINREATCLK